MAYTTINKSTDYFNTKLYTGNNTGQSITGVEFQPDLVWNKSRSNTESHNVWDAVRGTTKGLVTNAGDAESTWATGLTSFDSDGFTVGSLDSLNDNSLNFAAWCWKANGAGSSNTDGSITSTVSVNTTSGFSIVKYVGTGSLATVGHGLNKKPSVVIIKNLSSSSTNWQVYHSGIGATKYMELNNTGNAGTSASRWNDTDPTNQVFTINTSGDINTNGSNYIAYCWTDVVGYSKCGSYVGNNSSTFVYTGFKPKFLLLKNASATNGWLVLDAERTTQNPMGAYQYANANSAEGTVSYIDFLFNGFRLVSTTSVAVNQNGNTFIYMAFGQTLVGTNNIPATAF